MNEDSFFSLDRLVEFGINMSMAQQMINVMNQSMKSMYIPGSIQSMPKAIPQIYYVAIDGNQVGPLNDGEITSLVSQKRIHKDTLAWMPGLPSWKPIEKIPDLLKIIALTPPPLNEAK